MPWPDESVSIPAPVPAERQPVRIVFGPRGRDEVKVVLPDGRDIASDLRITRIKADICADGFAMVEIHIEAPIVEVLANELEDKLREQIDEVNPEGC